MVIETSDLLSLTFVLVLSQQALLGFQDGSKRHFDHSSHIGASWKKDENTKEN